MESPFRIPGDNGEPFIGDNMSDTRLAIKVAIPCLTLIVLGITTCVATPRIIEATKYDPYFEGYCHEEIFYYNSYKEKCPHSKHTAIFLHDKNEKPLYMICKCDGQPLIMKPLGDNPMSGENK